MKGLESWLKWFTYGMTIFIGSRAAYLAVSGYSHSHWNDIIVIPVLFAWIEALLVLSRYPTWGFCILMFFRVALDVVKVGNELLQIIVAAYSVIYCTKKQILELSLISF